MSKELKNLQNLNNKCKDKESQLETLRNEFARALFLYAVSQVTTWKTYSQNPGEGTVKISSNCEVDKSLYELIPWGGVHLGSNSSYLELDQHDGVLTLEVHSDLNGLKILQTAGLIPDISRIIAEQKSAKLNTLKSRLSELVAEIAELEGGRSANHLRYLQLEAKIKSTEVNIDDVLEEMDAIWDHLTEVERCAVDPLYKTNKDRS